MTTENGDAHCQMKGCTRPQYKSKTAAMYRESQGEEWPDDVQQHPICRRHWALEVALKEGLPLVFIMAVALAIGLWYRPLLGGIVLIPVLLVEAYDKLIKNDWRRT